MARNEVVVFWDDVIVIHAALRAMSVFARLILSVAHFIITRATANILIPL